MHTDRETERAAHSVLVCLGEGEGVGGHTLEQISLPCCPFQAKTDHSSPIRRSLRRLMCGIKILKPVHGERGTCDANSVDGGGTTAFYRDLGVSSASPSGITLSHVISQHALQMSGEGGVLWFNTCAQGA